MSHYFGSIRPYYKGVDKAEAYPNTEVYQTRNAWWSIFQLATTS